MPAIDARITYRQFGNPKFVMCENPNNTEAVHHPAKSFFEARESMFCNSPRKSNSSGHAVKKKIPREVSAREGHACHCGAKRMKCMPVPSGMAIHANRRKLPSTKYPHRCPHAIE